RATSASRSIRPPACRNSTTRRWSASATTGRAAEMPGEAVRADAAPKPVGTSPHARRVGDLLFLSGIGPRDPATDAIPGNDYSADGRVRDPDITAPAHAVFAN